MFDPHITSESFGKRLGRGIFISNILLEDLWQYELASKKTGLPIQKFDDAYDILNRLIRGHVSIWGTDLCSDYGPLREYVLKIKRDQHRPWSRYKILIGKTVDEG